MNDSDRNNPKPLPDDFGMTLPNYRPPKQKPQPDNFDLTTPNLRSPNQQNKPSQPPALPPDDFGMTIPNIQRQPRQPSPPNDFDLTTPNIRPNTPPEPDFGLTMPGGNYSSSAGSREPDFGATMPYISLPQSQRDEIRQETQPPVVPVQTQREEKRRGIPIWAWLVSGGLA
ncbi:MAG TPA: hypothetical protein VEX64_03055, partial [Pyrinomonadaceae bacterium]|nr:hypothetical protein [Pyrinomonadaceae bacterium]